MSVLAESRPAAAQTDCAHCGATLTEDQEWCLECGTARTLIHGTPDWRIALAIVGLVVALVVVGAVIALNGLSGDANRSSAADVAKSRSPSASGSTATGSASIGSSTSAAQPPGPPTSASDTGAPAASPARASIADWPVGLGGWTVILATSSSRAPAETQARRIAATGTPVGVLDSSQHPRMTPGLWVVFSGRYPTSGAAQVAAANLRASGHSAAHVHIVALPGGN